MNPVRCLVPPWRDLDLGGATSNGMNVANILTKKWYKKRKWWFIGAGVLAVIALYMFYSGDKSPTYEMITTQKGDLVQEVSVTGKIRPAQAVDLQFESSGRISFVNYKVGDKVNTGATIVSLENMELQAAVTSAKADLEKTKRNFESLNDSSISSSLRVELENAKASLDQIIRKADGDLASKYNSAFNALNEAMTQIDSSSATLEYIRKTHLEGKSLDDYIKQLQVKTSDDIKSVKVLFPSIGKPGVTIMPVLYGQLDPALKEMLNALQSIRTAFTFLQNEMESNYSIISSATDRTSVNTEAAAISSDLSAVSSAIQGILDQRISNDKNISDADAKLATAKASFPTSEDILQKESALLSAQSQLRKTIIVAPFAGIVGKIDAERGETISSTKVIVSFISAANYQIEANITEVDISKIKVGDTATLTLDAYGSQTKFNACVSSIDTSATVVEGVTTYITVFDFEGEVDRGIRPNMTANLDVQTAKKELVISIPQRAVISRNGDKIVRIYKGANITLEERVVQLGMSGKDGYIEIISGLSEGESIITFINE